MSIKITSIYVSDATRGEALSWHRTTLGEALSQGLHVLDPWPGIFCHVPLEGSSFSSLTDEAALFILVLLPQVLGITILSHGWPPTHPLSEYSAIFVALCSNLLIFSQLKYNLYKGKDYIWCTPVSLEPRIVTIMCRKYTVDPKGSGINCIPWYPWIQRTLNPVAIVVFTTVKSLHLPGPSSSNCCQVNCISN